MLYFGEEIGNGLEPSRRAVDPIEARASPLQAAGAISVVALAERGSMFTTHVHYMKSWWSAAERAA